MKLRCLIVEDHEMFLDLLLIALSTIPEIEVVATAKSVAEAQAAIRGWTFDLALLDYALPDGTGLDLARTLRQTNPDTKVLILTAHLKSLLPRCAFDEVASFSAVIDKVDSIETLCAEIERIVRERFPATPGHGGDHRTRLLTARELEIYLLIGEGLSNKNIGDRLGITYRTVESHRKAIARKTGLCGSSLVREAALYGSMTLTARPEPPRRF